MELEHKGMPRVERFFRIIAVASTFSLLAVVVYTVVVYFSLWPCFVGFVFFQFRAKKKKKNWYEWTRSMTLAFKRYDFGFFSKPMFYEYGKAKIALAKG